MKIEVLHATERFTRFYEWREAEVSDSLGHRSTSVGDLIILDGRTYWLVAGVGFKEVKFDQESGSLKVVGEEVE